MIVHPTDVKRNAPKISMIGKIVILKCYYANLTLFDGTPNYGSDTYLFGALYTYTKAY